MTHFENASEFYRTYSPSISPDHLTHLISLYIREGCVVSTPDLFALFKVREFTFGKVWWIEYFSGDMRMLVGLFPFWLPFVAFERRRRVRCYATATIINKLFSNDDIQDGPSDPLLRRGRGWWETQDSTSTQSHSSG